MAKINLTTQHNQENSGTVAALGLLICMIVTIVGIKLWWFKHRLTFEQSSKQNSAADIDTPAVIVPRRSKQKKYKKDKRYSQQIYESVKVHGVFRQKIEDDGEIQRPHQLPPVRIRKSSESTIPLILPLPPTKRRELVHSTAFEDLEIATPPHTTASSSDLTPMSEINTKITLTFEEFETQFKLKQVKSEAPESIEIPIPPVRLNRSTSATTKPEKHQHFLKSSQSITIPEFHKVIEKRVAGLSSPKEDLTKIDDYDEAQIFASFVEGRLTGYIKYEEVDNDLNEKQDKAYKQHNLIHNKISEGPANVLALQALRNESIIYNKNVNKSPDIQLAQKYNFNTDYTEDDFVNYSDEIIEVPSLEKLPQFDSKNVKENCDTKFNAITERSPKEFDDKKFSAYSNSTEEQPATELSRNGQSDEEALAVVEYPSFSEKINYGKIEDTATECIKNGNPSRNKNVEELYDLNFQKDFDNQFTNCAQFEEEKETPKVIVLKVCSSDLEAQNHMDENAELNVKETGNRVETKRVPPAGFHNDCAEPLAPKDMQDCQNNFNKKFYNQIRCFMTTEHREVTFDPSEYKSTDKHTNSAIRERRPTGFVRDDDYFVTFSDESDEGSVENIAAMREKSPDNLHSNVEIYEIKSPKVNFADIDSPTWQENGVEKFTLNQRRPTGFSRPLNDEEKCINTGHLDSSQDSSRTQVHFSHDTDLKVEQEVLNSNIKQKRPTSYTESTEIFNTMLDEKVLEKQMPLGNMESSMGYDKNSNDYTDTKEPRIVKFQEIEETFKDYESHTNSLLKQRRPTGFVRKQEIDELEKEINLQFDDENKELSTKKNQDVSQIGPTGLIKNDEIVKHVGFEVDENSHEDGKTHYGNDLLKQRRPTGFIRKNELKCLDQHALIIQSPNNDDNNQDFDNNLWHEMEQDVDQNTCNNIEEEFCKIRHSYEMNEADFLEVNNEAQKASTINQKTPLGFGRSIEEDWENFEKLKISSQQSPEKIEITFSDTDFTNTTSILKEHKLEEDIQAKPRKSKVTFDFKTDERVIPARKSHNNSEEDLHYDKDVYDKLSTRIPPQPMQRLSNINYNTNKSPFDMDDSWLAIRKHRYLTDQFQNISTNSEISPLKTSLKTQPKPSYRNPLAQIAIQRAKEVRADMDGFKSRSINKRKAVATKGQSQKSLNLSSGYSESTEA